MNETLEEFYNHVLGIESPWEVKEIKRNSQNREVTATVGYWCKDPLDQWANQPSGFFIAQYQDNFATEGPVNLNDGDAYTTFLIPHASCWIQFNADAPFVLRSYSFTSSDDAPEGDPLNWTVKGFQNGSDWTTLDSRGNEDFTEREQTKHYNLSNQRAYRYYRFELQNNSGNALHLAEVGMW